MRALKLTTLSSTLALALCMNAGAAETAMSKAEYDDAKAKISTQFKTAKAACDAQQGNAKSICMEEAKGQEKVSMAELEYQREPSARHSQQLITANADAAYAVAKQKCDGMAGANKDNCMKDAKTAHTQSLSEPKMMEKSSTNTPDGGSGSGSASGMKADGSGVKADGSSN